MEAPDYFAVMGDPAVILDGDNVIVRANLAFLRDISGTIHESRSFTNNFIHSDDLAAVTSVLATFRNSPSPSTALPATTYAPFANEDPTLKPIRARFQTLTLTTPIPRWVTHEWTISQHPTTRFLYLVGRPIDTDEARDISKAAQFEDFFENAPIALHWLSGEGIVLWANKTELDFLGYTKEEYIGQKISKFCPDEAVVVEIFKTLGSGNTIHDVPVRVRHKDGTIKNILVDSNVNYHPDGTFHHTRCFIRDDTARKLKEEKFKVQLEAAENATKLKDNFLQSVAHDLRTPMQALLGNLQLLSSTPLNDTQTEYTETILAAGTDLCRMLDNIVDAIKDDEKHDSKSIFSFSVQPFDLKAEIEGVIKRMAALVHDEEVVVSLAWHGSTASKLPRLVKGDAVGIRRVLMNLVGNAIRFTTKGFITVTVKFDRTDAQGRFFKISVIDTGMGIAEEDLPMVWKKYWQKPPAPGKGNQQVSGVLGTGGVGLGLHISKMLVEAMGGQIGVESSQVPGRAGSTFWVKLPLEVQTDQSPEEPERVLGRQSRAPSTTEERPVFDITPSGSSRLPQSTSGRIRDWIATAENSHPPPDNASVFSEGVPPSQTYRDRRARLSRQSSFDASADPHTQARSAAVDPTVAIQAIMKQSQAAIENIVRMSGTTRGYAPPIEEMDDHRNGVMHQQQYLGGSQGRMSPDFVVSQAPDQGSARQHYYSGYGRSSPDLVAPQPQSHGQSHFYVPQGGPQPYHAPSSSHGNTIFQELGSHRSSPPVNDRYQQPPVYHRSFQNVNDRPEVLQPQRSQPYLPTFQYSGHSPRSDSPPDAYSRHSQQQSTPPEARRPCDTAPNYMSHPLPHPDTRRSSLRSQPDMADSGSHGGGRSRSASQVPQSTLIDRPQDYRPPPVPGTQSTYLPSPLSPQNMQQGYSTPQQQQQQQQPRSQPDYPPRAPDTEPSYFALTDPPNPTSTPQILMPPPTTSTNQNISLLTNHPLRVLVVEDNALCQRVVTQILKKLGCTIDTAADGVECIKAWEKEVAERGGWDVILMDVRMPNMDGITATRVLRERGCAVPIVAVTAERGEAERFACLNCGMNAFLSKPVLVNDLVARLVEFGLAKK
ncbi:hypothetical protein HDV00_002825 [Rhizophlyctis rosea]|nr:hypothetical protein HDV00_002825 [Rhizophlyctis rosea]